jgi:hypothetical protein
MADAIDQILADAGKWRASRPPFALGQLWQCDAVDAWRVFSWSEYSNAVYLRLEAIGGRRSDAARIIRIDQRDWPTAERWCLVERVQLVGGEVLT